MRQESMLKASLISLVVFILALTLIVMPKMAGEMAAAYPEFAYLKLPGLIIVYLSLIPFLLDIYETWKLLKMITSGEVFTGMAVKSLERVKNYTLIIFSIYLLVLVTIAVLNVPFSAAYVAIAMVCLATLAGSAFSSILKKVLLIAIEYKSENELTI